MTSTGLRRSLEYGVLVLVPLATLALWPWVLAAKGPYWLGQNSDPDYVYLLNALSVAEGHAPDHTDHPGTTVQLLGAGLLRVFHAVAGEGRLADDVLRRAEGYLTAVNYALLALYAVVLVLLALLVRRATRSTVAGALAAATPLLSTSLVYSAVCVKPEPLLAVLAAGLGLCAVAVAEREERRRSLGLAALLGVLSGAAIITKVTAAPLLVLPALLLVGWRSRLVFTVTTALSALVLVAPARQTLVNGLRLLRQIATHRGIYGSGEESLVDVASYVQAVPRLLLDDPLLAAALAAGAGALAFDRLRAHRGPAGLRAALRATVAAQAACLLFVARHPKSHYLVPALGLTGVVLGLALALLAQGVPRPGRLARAALLLLLVAAAAVTLVELRALHRRLDAMRVDQLSAARAVERLGSLPVLHYYRSSSPAFALYFGNIYASMRYAPQATALYPNAYFYNIFFDLMDPRLSAVPAGGSKGFALQGTPLDEAALARIRLAGRWTRVYGNDLEAVYELE